MSTDRDIESILSTSDSFCKTPEISYSSPIEDIAQAVVEHGESGTPCVITGLPFDTDEQSPFRQSTEWMKSIYANRGRSFRHFLSAFFDTPQLVAMCRPTPTGPRAPTTPQVRFILAKWCTSLTRLLNHIASTLPCPPEWITWLQESFIVPSCLVPHGGNCVLPDGARSIFLRLFGPELGTSDRYTYSPPIIHSMAGSLFWDDSSSTFMHDLLCVGGTNTGKYWFMTAAEDWPKVTEYLRARDGSKAIRAYSMSLQELSRLPFNVYVHLQKKGDLVILPPRRLGHLCSLYSLSKYLPSFSQTIHRGITASLCWERITLQALEAFIYHDMIFKQRYDGCEPALYKLTLSSICARIRHHPHRILCDTVRQLHEELANLKQSQPSDLTLFSEKSRILERGFRLLDEVINSSYCSQDELLPLIGLTLQPPCSFCGGELFRTVFRCADSCTCDDTTGGSVDSKILICNLCFVDGRACRCGSMKPYRLQPLEGLIELRTNIADLLGLTDEGEPSWLWVVS